MQPFTLARSVPYETLRPEVDRILAGVTSAGEDPRVLRHILSVMDLTTLDGTDHPAKIRSLCSKALSLGEQGLPFPAAVCIYPPFIAGAKKALEGSPIRVATTAAAFPSGQMALRVKLEEIRYAAGEGADEIDVVISRGTFLAGDSDTVFGELEAMRELCRGITLKVILETGELHDPEIIARAAETAIRAGADFIKTSTGKVTPAATPEAVWVMLQVIRDHFRTTGNRIGIKPAGGIAEPVQALAYYHLVSDVLGQEWLTPSLFRLGASRLADRIVERLT